MAVPRWRPHAEGVLLRRQNPPSTELSWSKASVPGEVPSPTSLEGKNGHFQGWKGELTWAWHLTDMPEKWVSFMMGTLHVLTHKTWQNWDEDPSLTAFLADTFC